MQNALNALICNLFGTNTGKPYCDVYPDFPIGGFLTPQNYQLSGADIATPAAVLAALIRDCSADNPNNRVLPIYTFVTITPTGEAATTQTFGNGTKRQVRGATIAYDYLMAEGKFYHTALKPLSKKFGQYKWLAVDLLNQLFGTNGTTPTGAPALQGYTLSDLEVSNYVPLNGTDGAQFTFSIGFANSAEVDINWAYVPLPGNPFSGVIGLQTVTLTATAGATPPKVDISAAVGSNQDLFGYYGTALAVPAAFVIKNASTGLPIHITGVAPLADGWEATLDTADANYPGAGGKVTVALAAPSVLTGIMVYNIDGTKTATVTLHV